MQGSMHRFRFRLGVRTEHEPHGIFRARESVVSEWGCVVSPSTRAGGGAASHRFRNSDAVNSYAEAAWDPSGLRGGIGGLLLLECFPQWQCFPREHSSLSGFERGLGDSKLPSGSGLGVLIQVGCCLAQNQHILT